LERRPAATAPTGDLPVTGGLSTHRLSRGPEEDHVTQQRSGPYPAELREIAVRRVLESSDDHPSQWAAIEAIAAEMGIGTAETLRKWVRREETDDGRRAGITSIEESEIKRLRRENAELRRQNAILRAASAFFGAELDRPLSAS
jgi:transposase